MERLTSSRNSIISLQSSSLFSPENQDIVNELAEKLQTTGTKVNPLVSYITTYIAKWQYNSPSLFFSSTFNINITILCMCKSFFEICSSPVEHRCLKTFFPTQNNTTTIYKLKTLKLLP